MAIVNIENVKAKFEAGDSPRSSDYIDMIDTLAAMPDISGKQDTASAVSNAGGSTITASGATVKPLVLKGFASQTANLQEWQNSTGTVLANVDASGKLTVSSGVIASTEFYSNGNVAFSGSLTQVNSLSVGAGNSISGRIQIKPYAANNVGLVIQGYTSQTANLQEWQDSAGTVLAKVTPTGSLVTTSTHTAKTISYTFGAGDEGQLFSMNAATSVQFNIPTDATFNFAIGTEINVFWITGAGQPTIGAATPGTTAVISTGSGTGGNTPKLRVANSGATCKKIAANSWIVFGDLA